MKQHHWTAEELEIVRRDYDGTGVGAQRIADRLGVTVHAVHGKIQFLGVARNTGRRAWTQREEELLAEYIGKYAISTIARKMNRSLNSVVVKAKRLRLSLRARDGWFTKTEVCEILGVDHHWVQRRIDSGELKAGWNSDCKPQRSGAAYWRITTDSIRQFIVEHANELTGRNIDLVMIVHLLNGELN
uniref:Putative DNA binding, helix-turn-helix domain containing protein n=1 Tax=viral metagenome TaxID=1070528 RepID=A0A6M3KJQ6_9ZZZZ